MLVFQYVMFFRVVRFSFWHLLCNAFFVEANICY
jgi:hypothetical protein